MAFNGVNEPTFVSVPPPPSLCFLRKVAAKAPRRLAPRSCHRRDLGRAEKAESWRQAGTQMLDMAFISCVILLIYLM